MTNFVVHLRRVRPVSVAVRHRIRPTFVTCRRRRCRRLVASAYAFASPAEFRGEGFARFSSWWCFFRSRKGEKTDLRYIVTCALSAFKMKGAPPSPTGSGNMSASGSGNNNAGGGSRHRHRKRSSSDESRGGGWFRIPRPALSIPLMMKKSSSRDESKAGGDKETTLEDETAKKYRSMWIRTLSSIWMIGGFVLIVYMGHLYIWAMIVVIQLYMAQELFTLARAAQREKQLPGFRLLNWHFFLTAMLYVYGRFLNKHLVKTIRSDHLIPHLFKYGLIKYHMLICYSLYIAGFVWFILTLKRGMYKYQFGQFAWTHMILFVVFAQSSFTVANIFEGIIWFLLPASLIVINDIMAYFFGVFFGKTPLIKLSPKKTWEGFIGASFSTVVSAFMLAYIMGQSEWLTCPRKDLSTGWLHCDPGPLFRPIYHPLPAWTPQWFPWKEFGVMPVQTHAMAFGLFASLVAPFGGFFASGFKRAFNIKDFGDSIPGHGGITDRMDCQMVMAVFSYIYYQSFISPHHYSIESFLDQILVNLSLEEQMGLYKQLGEALTRSQR